MKHIKDILIENFPREITYTSLVSALKMTRDEAQGIELQKVVEALEEAFDEAEINYIRNEI